MHFFVYRTLEPYCKASINTKNDQMDLIFWKISLVTQVKVQMHRLILTAPSAEDADSRTFYFIKVLQVAHEWQLF